MHDSYIVLCTIHVVLCTIHVVLCTIHIVLCTIHVVLCTIHVVLCTIHIVLCTIHVVLLKYLAEERLDRLDMRHAGCNNKCINIFGWIITMVGLERGPLNLVKVEAPVSKTENTVVVIRHADHVAPSIRKSWH
jgi:hypothetical protein